MPIGEWVIQAGPTGLLAIVVVMILTGLLVPRSTLRDAYRQRDEWREAHDILAKQNTDLLIGARVATDVMRALPDPTVERT